jgi:sucrose-6-phosphate hydrolase SacC (GH32 family)
MKRKLRPVLDGEWRLICPSPDLSDQLGPGNAPEEQAGNKEKNAVVDNHAFQDACGTWHAWACIRATAVGRILYHWKSDDFFASPWQATGEIIRCDRAAGESLEDYHNQEWIQSPYIIREGNTFYMFYGGHTTGVGPDGKPAYDVDDRNECQMCLMTSPDGVTWTRHRDADGFSRVFVGPGEVRDPSLIKIGELWYCYYAGYETGDRTRPGFYARTSKDLIHWSEPKCIHRDYAYGDGRWNTECPHVVYRDGYYYLLRTVTYYESNTQVFRSEDPLDFGVNDASEKHVGVFPVAAPEIILGPDGREYVLSVHQPPKGMQICPIRWEPAE